MPDPKLNLLVDLQKARLQNLERSEWNNRGIRVEVLRLDQIHPVISGNKWFKLKYYLEEALHQSKQGILSFGGAYSNHILATAAAAREKGLSSIGIIRGEKGQKISPTLADAEQLGMRIEFLSRKDYRRLCGAESLEFWTKSYPGYCIIAEGGAGSPGKAGAAEILQLVDPGDYTHILAAVGTGTMLAGLIMASSLSQKIVGVSVLKGFDKFSPEPVLSAARGNQIQILAGYHFGGYARKNPDLIRFMNSCYDEFGLPTDFVYTGKLLYAVFDQINKGSFPAGSNLLIVHSGGLQGNRSLPAGTLKF